MRPLPADLADLQQRLLSERQVRQLLRIGQQTLAVARAQAKVVPIERGRYRYYTLADLDGMIAAMRGTTTPATSTDAAKKDTSMIPPAPRPVDLTGRGNWRAFCQDVDKL